MSPFHGPEFFLTVAVLGTLAYRSSGATEVPNPCQRVPFLATKTRSGAAMRLETVALVPSGHPDQPQIVIAATASTRICQFA